MNEETPSAFGEMLKAFRKRERLTQQKLATTLGVHPNTIGGWERGDVLPTHKGIVLELVKRLHLDSLEGRRLLEASLTSTVPYWNIPIRRNPFFTGREQILEALHTYLGTDQLVALTQSYAIHGLGGIGKTQLAVEYAYRHALDYTAIFWIAAESSEHILSSFLAIAAELLLPEKQEADQQRVVAAVQRWLNRHDKWLLIWDNLEDMEPLQRYLPSVPQGAILITMRSHTLGTLAHSVELPTMTPEEGMLLLLRRAKVLPPQATKEHAEQLLMKQPAIYSAAREVATVLGGLPLALDQAAAYVDETGCGLEDYLQRYKQQRKLLLDRRGMVQGDHPHSVTATFELASQRVEREHPAAAEFLRMCAFLHAEAIPEELFVVAPSYLSTKTDKDERLAIDPYQLDQIIAALRTLSLVQRYPEKRTFSIHRLAQAVIQEEMSEQESAHWQRQVIHTLNALFPDPNNAPEVWGKCEQLLPHVLSVAAVILEQAQDLQLVQVLGRTADYLRERAQFRQSELLYQQALSILKRVAEPEHPDAAPLLQGLATLFRRQGKYKQAESLYQQALCIREQFLGPEHPDVATSLNGLALIYREHGEYEQAKALFQRALHIRELALGPDHPNVSHPLTNLAELCRLQGKYELAEPLYLRSLSILEQAFGPWYPEIATPLYNLAILYSDQGKYEKAEPLYLRALDIMEQNLGPEHPDIAYPLINLAENYRLQGKYEQAEPLYQRALALLEQNLGSEHSLVAYPLANLAELSYEQGKYELAEPLYQRALSIWEQSLGPEHPNVAHTLNGLAALYTMQNKYELARPFFERALAIRQQHLGLQHPETAQTMHDFAILHQRQNDLQEAASLAQQALQIRQEALGTDHPKTLSTSELYIQIKQTLKSKEKVQSTERNKPIEKKIATLLEQAAATSFTTIDPIQAFLSTCCELHPLASCRSAELWQAYQRWAQKHGERHMLSQLRFLAQLKAHGCLPARTSKSRIWRGITLKHSLEL